MIVTKLRIGDANTMMQKAGSRQQIKKMIPRYSNYLDCFGGGHFASKTGAGKKDW